MKTAVMLIALLLTAPNVFSGDYLTHTIEILSDPPGIDIEVNGEYAGQTPTLYTVKWDATAQIVDYDEKSVTIRALPKEDKHYAQTKVLSLYPMKAETMVKKVFFNMYSPPKE